MARSASTKRLGSLGKEMFRVGILRLLKINSPRNLHRTSSSYSRPRPGTLGAWQALWLVLFAAPARTDFPDEPCRNMHVASRSEGQTLQRGKTVDDCEYGSSASTWECALQSGRPTGSSIRFLCATERVAYKLWRKTWPWRCAFFSSVEIADARFVNIRVLPKNLSVSSSIAFR